MFCDLMSHDCKDLSRTVNKTVTLSGAKNDVSSLCKSNTDFLSTFD